MTPGDIVDQATMSGCSPGYNARVLPGNVLTLTGGSGHRVPEQVYGPLPNSHSWPWPPPFPGGPRLARAVARTSVQSARNACHRTLSVSGGGLDLPTDVRKLRSWEEDPKHPRALEHEGGWWCY